MEEFRDSLAAMGITYSLRYIRQCFNKLVNAELVKWYSLAEKARIIDAIDLKHLPCYMGELSVRLLNRNRQRPFDPPFILTPWHEAMALHPLQDLLDVGEPDEAVEVLDEYQPSTGGI